MELSAKFMSDFRADIPAALCGVPVTSCTDYQSRVCRNMLTGEETPVTLPKSNVVTLVLGEKGSVIVRPSGTEPKVKFYYTSVGSTRELAQSQLDAMIAQMSK